MKKALIALILIVTVMTSCQQSAPTSNNPFFSEYTTPFGVPPFDLIKESHYMPAFTEGIKQQEEEIAAIINNSAEPTFENTILAFDKSGALLQKVALVFFNVKETDVTDSLQSIAREVTPLLTRHSDNIAMNQELFTKVKAVYESRMNSGLDDSQIRVVEKFYRDFVRQGVELPAEKQDELRKLNEEISMLSLQFGENLLNETNKNFVLVVEKESDLAGLPADVVSAAAETAKEMGKDGNWVFTLQKPSWIPFLQYAENRDLREKLYRGYFMRGNNGNEFDNKSLVEKMVNLRSLRAELLGYSTHAQYVIDDNMAKTPEKVYEFLNQLWTPALERAKAELNEMQAIIDREGGKFKLESWDWWYYSEKLRKEKYDLDESEMKPYFKLENVRDGMFWVANQLYGITFNKVTNLPVYNAEVEAFEVKEADGKHVGILYLDYFPRASKSPGAWCTSFRNAGYRDGKIVDPVISISCNFTKPTGNVPSLLTWDEVQTMFHEFGHGLHFLFAEGKYNRTAGVVPTDYVELPSQIMENWVSEPEVLKQFAIHYETGEKISDELIAKIVKSGHFNQGFATVEYLAASILDLDWHGLNSADKISDVSAFETASMNKMGLIKEILPRYRTTYFAHIFNGGYSSGYYVYIWAAVLDADAFNAFKESGDIFNKELAEKFRTHCLVECGEGEGMDQYRKFRGKDPVVEPLLRNRGLK